MTLKRNKYVDLNILDNPNNLKNFYVVSYLGADGYGNPLWYQYYTAFRYSDYAIMLANNNPEKTFVIHDQDLNVIYSQNFEEFSLCTNCELCRKTE